MAAKTVEQVREEVAALAEPFGYSEDVPFHDFNREIYHPNQWPRFPAGVVGIRCDDDFWTVAMLPYDFVDTPLAVLVEALWPDIASPRLEPDSTMPAYYMEHGFPKDEKLTDT